MLSINAPYCALDSLELFLQHFLHVKPLQHKYLRGIFGYDVKYGGINYELAYRIYEKLKRLVK
ncbi:MAG: hypothetical protein FWE33_06110 [Defluviitaleaceae bacterium]|nr:hypothetical protein [Defluviitaleaceae bacterium]